MYLYVIIINMPKKTVTTLVIVESPAKCKKIESYLGPGYKCIASFGHLREISSLNNINIQENFTPTYTIIENNLKKKQVELLKKEIQQANEVIIASDSDREGEAIGYSIIELFKLPKTIKRIVFNEITETAIQFAIQNPKKINMDLVYAQQARQILDVLVGFKISPILWDFIKKNKENPLSAGRCQTPALRLIYDNQKEIDKLVEEKKVYNTDSYFTSLNLRFSLDKHFETKEQLILFLEGSKDFQHIFTCSSPVKSISKPPEPFITSTIQQAASNELHFSPKETMIVCQKLYEGGFITYMRTDAKKYSKEFIDSIKIYIEKIYNSRNVRENYINEEIDSYTNTQEAKEAHEAIRPTNISLLELPESVDNKERKLYRLIWERTIESCMASSSCYVVTATITAFQSAKFTYKSEKNDFLGWKIVSKKYLNDLNKKTVEYDYLQKVNQNNKISYKKMCSTVTIKGSKLHFTEARLVQLLEEKGIGRPSTFSSLVEKIQDRNYVKKQDIKGREILCYEYELEDGKIIEKETKKEFGNEKGKLVIQPLGIIVMEFLEKHFDKLFNYEYTCIMEKMLDKVSKGEIVWNEICNECNICIDKLISELDGEKKLEFQLDETHTYLVGKYGPVIKCTEEKDGKQVIQFKSIKKDVTLEMIKNKDFRTVDDLIEQNNVEQNNVEQNNSSVKQQYILGKYNDLDVILKKGKFGLFMSWGNNSKTLKTLGNRPIENITFEEVQKYLQEESSIIREISPSLSIRKGAKGNYLFYKNAKMKKPTFYDINSFEKETRCDYNICDLSILKEWILKKYNTK